jgi:hypothetical protein
VFENRALRRIFGSKRKEVTEGWRKCIHNLCSSPHVNRLDDDMGDAYSTHGTDEKYIQFQSENLTGKNDVESLGEDKKLILKWM